MADGGVVIAICQYGGEFTYSPNGNLIYQGGEAHAVDVSHNVSLESFKDEVSKLFDIDATDMSVKYFLPNNNRTLITVSFDQELQRMVALTASAAQVNVFLVSGEENNRYNLFHIFLSPIILPNQAYSEAMDIFLVLNIQEYCNSSSRFRYPT
jgi:hypothetical protein